MAQALNLNLVNNNNNNNVNHVQNNCDCCGIFNNSTDLLAAKIRLATNNDQTPVTLTLEQLRMLQADLARIPQLEQSLQQKEVEVINLQNTIMFQNNTINALTSQIGFFEQANASLNNDKQNLENEINEMHANIQSDSFSGVVKKSLWNVAYSASYKVASSIGCVQSSKK